jgi:hemerythrin-like domain-containing protein
VEKAIEVLMNEHRLIERALDSLDAYASEVRMGRPAARDVVGEYAAFFRGFADGCHHGKEEDILFQRMVERGFPREAGPLAVMYHEHEEGRGHVRTLIAIAAGAGSIEASDSAALVACAGSYVPLLRQHILKEDNVLYPMALRVLTGPELDSMNTEFEAFEAGMRADGTYDRLQALAERLASRFRPAAVRMESPIAHPGR